MHPMFAAKKQITKYFSCPTISGLLVFLCLYAQNTKAISEKIKRDHVDEYYKRQAKVEPGTSIKLLLNRTRFRAKVSEYVYISLKVCGNLHTYCVFERYHYYFIQRNVLKTRLGCIRWHYYILVTNCTTTTTTSTTCFLKYMCIYKLRMR